MAKRNKSLNIVTFSSFVAFWATAASSPLDGATITPRTLQRSEAIPTYFHDLRQCAADVFADGFQQVLINEYAPGAGIGWHRDKLMFEEILGISLGSSCAFRYAASMALDGNAPRSIYVRVRPISGRAPGGGV